ncbi:MAG: antibiotic biosynthesis monooxygenase [Gemmataceae bacterium]|nr:antibiotic biosynthesis monooxygenase [Gemmataceae bacterium]
MLPRLLAVAALAATALTAPVAPAQDKPNPIAAQVKASLKDSARPFTMLVSLQVKEGAAAKFEAAFAKAIKATRAEKGCRAYDLNRDTKTPTHYTLYERWANLPALEAHLRTAHITALLAEVGDLLAAPPKVRVLVPASE